MGTHDGHRERMRKRYLRGGLENFDDLAILEFVLFYAIPRQDTNLLAHRLLDHYGDLASVLEASVEDLQRIEGVGVSAAVLLSLFTPVSRRHMCERVKFGKILDTRTKCGDYLLPRFFGEREEVMYLLCLDARLMVVDCRAMFRGAPDSVNISVRRVVETALSCGASVAVIAHNHPTGYAIPSIEDERVTGLIRAALETVDIQLFDHIIVAGNDYVSMAESGIL